MGFSVLGGLGGAGGRHLALCPALLDPATKASLIPIRLLWGGGSEKGEPQPQLGPLPGPQAKSSLGQWGDDRIWGLSRNPPLTVMEPFFFSTKKF